MKNTQKNNKFLRLAAINTMAAAAAYTTAKVMLDTALDREMPKVMQHSRNRISSADYNSEFLQTCKEATETLEHTSHEAVSVSARDGVLLAGHWFPHENPKRIIIAMHGWRSSWAKDFGMIAPFWQENECSVLYAEQRGQNNSGGDYMGFGMTEQFDCLSWVYWAIQRCGEAIPIYLAGVSMGATTVLMASGLALPSNVHGIMADCGFTSPYEIWKHIANHNLHLPFRLNGVLADYFCRKKLHCGSDDYSTIDALQYTSVPVIFAHGENDHFVPLEMTLRNFEACRSPKFILTVPDADHGMSYYLAKDKYENAICDFWAAFDN